LVFWLREKVQGEYGFYSNFCAKKRHIATFLREKIVFCAAQGWYSYILLQAITMDTGISPPLWVHVEPAASPI
jgi:hypothetical protein